MGGVLCSPCCNGNAQHASREDPSLPSRHEALEQLVPVKATCSQNSKEDESLRNAASYSRDVGILDMAEVKEVIYDGATAKEEAVQDRVEAFTAVESPSSTSDFPKTSANLPRQVDYAETESTASTVIARAKELARMMRIREAAELWQESKDVLKGEDDDFEEMLALSLQSLGSALELMGGHPGSKSWETATEVYGRVPEDCSSMLAERLLDINVPSSPSVARTGFSETLASRCWSGSRDLLNFDFDLDDKGHKVVGCMEFFADGTVSLEWTAADLPIPVAVVMCVIFEIDLLPDIAPYVTRSEVLHQFPFNVADRLIRIIAEPPIPFVSGFEINIHRSCFDHLSTPWGAICLFDSAPEWVPPQDNVGASRWRGVQQPPLFRAGLRQVDMQRMVAMARMTGKRGELTTVLFSCKADLRVPRSLLPNWLMSWLIKKVGRIIFQHVIDLVDKFDTTEHGKRFRNKPMYKEMAERIDEVLAAKKRGLS